MPLVRCMRCAYNSDALQAAALIVIFVRYALAACLKAVRRRSRPSSWAWHKQQSTEAMWRRLGRTCCFMPEHRHESERLKKAKDAAGALAHGVGSVSCMLIAAAAANAAASLSLSSADLLLLPPATAAAAAVCQYCGGRFVAFVVLYFAPQQAFCDGFSRCVASFF